MLFAIPAGFFVATLAILRDAPREGLALGVAAAYSFVPFMLAAGIAAFPLAAIESMLLAAFALALQSWALEAGRNPLMRLADLDSLWLLCLIAAVAAFAAMSQLRLLSALVLQAMRDPLTGCLRRESGTELLELQFLLAARHGAPLAVLFADIDRFKRVNDEFGHETGDRVLAEVAASLRGALRESDVLVRWGGEEFLAFLPHASRAEATAFIDRLRARGFGRMPDGRAVTLSIGLAEYPSDRSARALDLVALADQRMYAAKQAGRNRFVADDAGAAAEILAKAA
jgi:diguanylate cyclase (GGDEF)-like protein